MNITGIISALLSLRILGSAAAYLIGASLFFYGLVRARQIPEGRMTATGVVMPMLAGAFLLVLPSTLNSVNQTLFGAGHPLDWVQASQVSASKAGMAQGVLLFLQVLGLFAVIRGFLLLARVGDPQQREHRSLGASIAHLVGGGLLLNIQQTALAFVSLIGSASWTNLLQTALRLH